MNPANWPRSVKALRILSVAEPPLKPRLSRRQFRAWDAVKFGFRMNPNDRIVSGLGTSGPQCDVPECKRRAWGIVWCEQKPTLVCKSHYWPRSVARAHEARDSWFFHRAAV